MEHDEALEKESEKLLVAEISTGKTNDNESAVIDKVKDEDENLCRAEMSENEKNTSTLLKEDLHVVPENSKASDLDQDNETTSSSEERSTNVNLHGITSDITEDKKIDVVDTQKEVLESFLTNVSSNPEEGSTNAIIQGITSEKTIDEVDIQKGVLENSSTIGSNEETKEKSMIEVDGSETKIEELLEKENEKTSLPQPLVREASDDESMVMHEARIEDGEPRKAELCEIETSTEKMLLNIESKIEKPEDSLHVASEDIKTSDSSHEISSFGEESATTHPQDGKADDKAVDADEIKEEIHEAQNTSTSDSNEKTEENSLIQVGGHLEKDSEKLSWKKDFVGNANDDELTVTDEIKPEDVNRTELLKEKIIESDLLKEEVHVEKPVQSFLAVVEDNKACDLGQYTETTCFPEDQSLTKNPKGILGEKTEEEKTNASDTNEKTKEQQNVVIEVSNEDDDKNSSIQLDAPQMKHDTYLETEIEKPPLLEASTEDINDESTIMHEAKIGNDGIRKVGSYESDKNIDSTLLKKENLQEAPEGHKPSASSEDVETICSLDEQSLTANPQSIMSNKTSDATKTVENVATKTPHEHTEENLLIQVDCSQKEHLEKESKYSSLTEASMEETKHMHEPKDREEDLIKAELSENERNTVSTLVKEEAQVEKHTDSLQAALDDIKASDSTHGTKMSSDKEESQTADQQEITGEKTIDKVDIQKEVLENSSTIGSNEETEEKSMMEVDGSVAKIEDLLEKESEKTSSPQPLAREASDNESMVMHEARFEDREPRTGELYESETSTESMLLKMESKIEKPEDSLNVASEDIKTSGSSHEIETSSLEEQSATAHPQDGKTDDKALDAAEIKKEIHENVQTIVSNEKTKENSSIQVDCPQKKDENLEKDGEKPSLIKDLGQEIETSSFEEQSATAHSQIILDEKTEDKALDAAETEETLENVSTIDSNEKTEENLLIQVGGHLEKNSEKPSLIKDFIGNANDDELTVTDEVKPEDVNRAELLEKERNIESDLLKEEVHVEKPVQSFPAVLEDDKASDLGQHTETTSFREVQGLTENPQGTLSEKTEETTDAADTKKRTQDQQNVAISVSNEDNDKNSSIQLDASQMKHDTYLENEIEKPQLIVASTEDINDESTFMHEAEIGNESIRKVGLSESDKNIDSTLMKKENSQEAPEDHKPSASSEGIEATCSLDEQSSTANPQSIMSKKTIDAIDAIDTKEINLEHVATKIPHEYTEENLGVQVDCSQTEHEEHLKKESEDLSLTEASVEENNDNKSKLHEPKDRGEDLIKAELLENERNTVSTSVKEEAQVEKHTDSLQAAPDDIKAPESTHGTKMSSIEEEILTADPREISNDKKEETTDDAANIKTPELQDIATNIPDGDNENNSLIEEDGSEKQSLKEVSLGKADDNVSAVTHEANFVDEHLIKADLLEKEKHEGTLIKEEVPIESLQVADEDIKASTLVQERKKSSLEEQSLATNPQEIIGDNKEDKTNDATDTKEETHEDKNVATTTTYEDSGENSLSQVDCSQLEQNKQLDKESENTPLREAPTRGTTENTSVKEEAEMEKPIDYLQVATEDIKAPASGQDTETSSIEEQIPIADPQEISSENIEKKTVDAAYTKEKTLEDVATNVPNWDNEDNLPIEVDGLQKPSLKEASMGNTNDDESTNMHEVKFVDENLTKPNLFENEKSTKCTSVQKEVFTESLQEADENIKACASCQDRETISLEEQDLTTNPQRIMGDKEDKTSDATNLKEETPEEKLLLQNVATIPHEDTEEKSLSQVDSSLMEQKEHFKKESENAPLAESPTGGTIESTLKEEAPAEKSIECFQIVTGDIKASASSQHTEISSKEEQIPPANPQEISRDKLEEKTTDASYKQEELIEDIVANVPSGDDEDNSPVEVHGLQEPSLKEFSTGNSNDVEPPIIHEPKFEDEDLVKADLLDNEKDAEGILGKGKNIATTTPYEEAEENLLIQADCSQTEHSEYLEKETANPSLTEAQTGHTTESTLLKEESEMEKLIDSVQVPTENIKAFTSSQDTETSSIEQQILTVDSQEISCGKTMESIVGVTDTKEETLEVQDIAINVPSGDKENYSSTKVDGSQNSSLTESSTGNATTEDIAINIPSGDKKDSSPTKVDGSENPSLTEASTGNVTEVQDIATNIPSGDNEYNTPTKVDGSEEPCLTEASTENVAHHESKNMHEPRLVDERFLKADVVENEKNTDDTLIKEELSNESLQVTTEDIKASASGQDREPSSQEEQSLIANSREIMDDNREDKTIDATDLKEETSKKMASKSVVVAIPSTKDSDVNTDTLVDIDEDQDCKQEKSSITTASEEHMMTSNEPSEQDIDKTDTEKMTVLDDGSTKIPTNENLVETDPTESIKADAQVAYEENKAELKQQDTETGASQDVSDSSNSVALEEVSSSNVASEKDSISNPSLESRKETQLEAENEEAQQQDEDLHVSAPAHDLSMEKTEKDVELCPANATDSEITQEMQKLEEDTEREQKQTECKQEKVLLVETVAEIKEHASIPVANDFLPKSFIETSEIDHSTAEQQLTINKEDLQTGKTPTGDYEETKLEKEKAEEAGEQKISVFSTAAPNIIEAGDKDGANRSIADVEAKIDYEAPEIIQTAPSATENQEVESISVGETSASISQCERDDYEHAHNGTEEKPDSNEVGFAPEESKSDHEAKNQVLESIGQVQSCGPISKAEENLEAAAEIKSETVIVEDIFEPKETMKVNISSEKIKEDEDVQNDRLGSFKENAITESHLDQVSKVPEEADDKAVEEPEENLQANESKEQEKSIEDVTKVSDTGEVNSSTVAFLEDGDKSTRSDEVDNEMAKDEGFLNQNSNTSVEDAASGAHPKRPDENIMCEAPPTKTVHTTIDDTEDKKENANTIMMQHQTDDSKRKYESTPLPEFTQGIESEKQTEKDETCSSDEVQTKDEVNLMLSAGKEEAKKTDIRSKPTEDEDKNTYAEAEKVENLETKVSSEEQEAEANRRAPVSETLKQEIEEQQLERTFEPVTKAKDVNCQEEKIIDDDCNDLIGNYSSAASENISESNVHQSSMKDTSTTQSDKNQESERQIDALPVLPVAKCSDIEMAEKDLPMQFAGLDSTGVTELKVTPIPADDKHIVVEADRTKNMNPVNSIVNKNITAIEHGNSAECSQGEHELLKNSVVDPEEATCEQEERTSQETAKPTEKSESKQIDKPSLSNLLQVSTKETSQVTCHSANDKEPTPHSEHLQAEKSDEAEHEDTKTDEEKDDEDESNEQRRTELGSEAPVMVDTGDADVKVSHKKSHNILSGVGSKVKHSIAKVKKAITGKSSHPKPPSPK